MVPLKHKVAYLINTVVSPSGGTEKQLLLLLRHLDRELFEPTLFCLESSPWLEENFHECSLRILRISSFKSPMFLWRLAALTATLRRENFSVLQTHFGDANSVGILAARMAGVPVIISTRRGVPYWQSRLGLNWMRLLNTRVTFFLANSFRTRDWVVSKEGVAPERIGVVHNGVDPDLYVYPEQLRREGRGEFGLSERAPVIGIVANLRPVKGLDVFLRAAARVVEELPQARFLIIGEGDERQALQKLARALGIAGQVLFLGNRQDVPDLLSLLDVGVLSSNSESFSNAILEYLAAGLPVVCTDVGGCREVIEDGRDGFIVPPGDDCEMARRILQLLGRKPSSRERKRLRNRLERDFSIRAMVESHQQIYLQLLGGRPAAQAALRG